ncbi:histidine kinase [uncultured Winogradskyella sp.]|uniref:sensor histidine kinase n=1 Tax=uncultured Winogradskyella sp. TaxID=395353 RepID=UPI0026245E1B|nr:histidine kinase [uncultured Winogradskyella sp.]
MKKKFYNKRFMSIKVGELLCFIGFYFFFAIFYYITLFINRQGYTDKNDKFFNLITVIDDSGLDYFLKFLITIPIWYLLFRKLRHWSMSKRLLLHIVLLPTFVIVWQQLYYIICEKIGFYHLGGTGRVWDIYIPALFYILQFGIMHSYTFYVENRRKLKLEGELRTAALKSELSAIKAQLNPHFLYNIFNTISASVPPKNEKTRHLIAELSDLFRYQLKASQVEKVPLKEELEFVNKYLDLEKERFQERLKVEVNVEDNLKYEMVPPMLLQPLVENSIKHGLSSLIEGGKISISIFKKHDKLHFEISDTGIGIEDKTSVFEKGIGLTNTKLRLEKMYQSTLNLSDNQPQGLKISFAI